MNIQHNFECFPLPEAVLEAWFAMNDLLSPDVASGYYSSATDAGLIFC